MAPKADPKKKKEESSEEEESYEYETESSSEAKPAAKKADAKPAAAKEAAKPAAKKEESSEEESSEEESSYYETESEESSEKKPAAKPAAAAAAAGAAAKPAAAAAAKKEESESSSSYEYESEYETESEESSEKKPAAKPAAAAAKPAAAASAAATPAAAKAADAKPAAASSNTTAAAAKPAAAAAPANNNAAAQNRAVVQADEGPKSAKQWFAVYFAELIGTFMISFVIFQFRGQAMNATTIEPVGGVVSHALVQLMAVASVMAAFGHLSGGHFNPAITFMQIVLRQIKLVQGVLYIVLQFAGAILGGLLAWGLLPPATQVWHYGTGVAAPLACAWSMHAGDSATLQCWKEGFGAEIIGTFVVCFVYAMCYAAGNGEQGWLSTGLAYAISVFAFHNTGNGYFNPARAIGGAVFTFDYAWDNFWIFIIGPLIGSIMAIIIFGFIFQTKEDKTIGESILKH